MQYTIPIPSIGAAQMDDIRIQYLAIFFVPADHFDHGFLRFLGIKQSWPAVTGLYACAIILHHQLLVIAKVFSQWLNGGFGTAAFILG